MYQPNEGDRVRVVLEGPASETSENGFVIGVGANNYLSLDAAHVISVEKLAEPEPPSRSIVVDRDGDAWQSRGIGERWELAGDESGLSWKELTRNYGPIKVIHTPEA